MRQKKYKKGERFTKDYEPKKRYLCKITSCKHFITCNKIQIKQDKVKCIKYKFILD